MRCSAVLDGNDGSSTATRCSSPVPSTPRLRRLGRDGQIRSKGKGISTFLVETDSRIHGGPGRAKMGQHASIRRVDLRGLPDPQGRMMGNQRWFPDRRGRARRRADRHRSLGWGSASTIEYAANTPWRQAVRSPISNFQAIQWMIAESTRNSRRKAALMNAAYRRRTAVLRPPGLHGKTMPRKRERAAQPPQIWADTVYAGIPMSACRDVRITRSTREPTRSSG